MAPSEYLNNLTKRLNTPTINSHLCFNKSLIKGNRSISINKNAKVLALSGIADTQSFHKTLEQAGINICDNITFLDHHDYTQEDIAEITRKAKKCNVDIIVTTEKDMVKLKSYDFDKVQLFSLGIQFQIENKFEKELFSIIERKIYT